MFCPYEKKGEKVLAMLNGGGIVLTPELDVLATLKMGHKKFPPSKN